MKALYIFRCIFHLFSVCPLSFSFSKHRTKHTLTPITVPCASSKECVLISDVVPMFGR